MNGRTDHIFSVLVELDPVSSAYSSDCVAATDGLEETATEERIARILAQPRGRPATSRSGTPIPVGRAPGRSRLRIGAVGLVMSAAIAATTMVLWASPSGGQPTNRSLNAPAHVTPARGSLPASNVALGA